MLARLQNYLAAAGVILAAVVTAFVIGLSRGGANQKGKQAERALREVERAKRIEQDIKGRPSAGRDERFARWVRD